jgi:pyrophosphatase PpaX
MDSPSAFETFLFDLDGTLLDSIDLIMRSYRHTMLVHRGTAPDDAMWLAGLGTPLRVQFARVSHDAAEVETMVATYREYNLAHHDRMVRPFEGIVPAVTALAARGRLGLVTSKFRDGALRGLKVLGLEQHIRVIVGADDVSRPKPDAEPVRLAMERLDAHPDTTVFVGDSPHDLAAGRAAGVRTAAVLWGPFPRELLAAERPDYWIPSPAELTAL